MVIGAQEQGGNEVVWWHLGYSLPMTKHPPKVKEESLGLEMKACRSVRHASE